MTAPQRGNPISNIYLPKTDKFFPENQQKGEIVFISKKDAQIYKVKNIRGQHGESKNVLVNIRDKSVKGLKRISSVKSITSIKSKSSVRHGRKKKKKVKRKLKNKNMSSSLYNNVIVPNQQKNSSRKESKIFSQNNKIMTIPNNFTNPQNLNQSSQENFGEVNFSFIFK